MPDHNRIYREEAERYHQLIAKQPLLDEVIEEIRPFKGLDVVDIGAGTGRLSAVLAAKANSLTAVDASQAMLNLNGSRMAALGLYNWTLKVGEHQNLPLVNCSADLITAGWTIGYIANDEVDESEQKLKETIAEMKRVLRPCGTIIIFETMGTGVTAPNLPNMLHNYYERLEKEYGFSHKSIRLDYQFDSVQQAEESTRFFFGEELADQVVKEQWSIVPECAGVWWLHM